MNAGLEAQYRRGLRWYPRAWRAENADAIVGTMLDAADADGRTAPLRGELRNLAGSGLGTRVEAVAPQAVRDRVAAIALALGFASSLVMLVFGEWAPFATTGPWNDWALPPRADSFTVPQVAGFGPFVSAMVVVYAMWVVTFALVMLRFSRSAVVVILGTVPVLMWVYTVANHDAHAIHQSGLGLVVLGGLAMLAAIGHPARLGRIPIAVAVISSGVAIALVVALIPAVIRNGRLWAMIPTSMLDAPLLWLLLVLGGLIFSFRRDRGWGAALLVSSAPWAGLFWLFFDRSVLTIVVLVLVVAMSIGAASLVWRRRPPSTETA